MGIEAPDVLHEVEATLLQQQTTDRHFTGEMK